MTEILVDDREDNKIVQLLIKEQVPHKIERLNCFDYIIGDALAIEYKAINDFISSSYGHLQEQIANMKQNSPQVKQILIVICGDYDDTFWMRYRINEASYIGMLSSVIMKHKVNIIHFKRPQQFVRFLASCLNKLDNNNQIDTIKLKRLESKDNTELSLLCALPSISQTKAQKILEKYNIKLSLIDKNTQQEVNKEQFSSKLKEFNGIGNKIVENLIKYFY